LVGEKKKEQQTKVKFCATEETLKVVTLESLKNLKARQGVRN